MWRCAAWCAAAIVSSIVPVAAVGSRAGGASANPERVAAGPRLTREAAVEWDRYVAATERRRAAELTPGGWFLLLDLRPRAPEERRALFAGEVVIRSMELRDAAGEIIEVPGARVHHWRGAIFIPGATVDRVVNRLKQSPPPQQDVLRAKVLARGADTMTVALRLRRTKIMTVVYDTEHHVTFETHGQARASSATRATRIVELADPGEPAERELAPGEDHGFLWRLNAYWRYEQVAGGVIAECESISLSRDVPFGLATIAGPIISSTARDAMQTALEAVKHSAAPTR
jgi:hypothetical protein